MEQARTVRVVTYNILNTKDRYIEREPFLKETLHGFDADIVSLQEVAFGVFSLDELVVIDGA